MRSLVQLVLEVHDALDGAGLPHAFGGALALAHHAEPRGTVDIDVNVFVPLDRSDQVVTALAAAGVEPDADTPANLPIAGIRLRPVEPFPVDVFCDLDERYAEVARRVVWHPFGPDLAELPFLGAEDLAVFKLSFGRLRDWADLDALARSRPDLDVEYVERQLVGLRGPTMYPRLARLRSMVRQYS